MKDFIDRKMEDYIIVKDWETAKSLLTNKAPPSLRGKYIIVAPKGLRFVSKEDIARLPQVKSALLEQRQEIIKKVDFIKKVCSVEQNEEDEHCECMDYNQAIDEVLKILKDI